MQGFFALVLMGLLAAVLVTRYTGKLDRSWPLIVWVSTIVFSNAFEGAVDPRLVYGGVICALLLRFEFMGGWVMKVVRALESIAIVTILWALFRVVRGY